MRHHKLQVYTVVVLRIYLRTCLVWLHEARHETRESMARRVFFLPCFPAYFVPYSTQVSESSNSIRTPSPAHPAPYDSLKYIHTIHACKNTNPPAPPRPPQLRFPRCRKTLWSPAHLLLKYAGQIAPGYREGRLDSYCLQVAPLRLRQHALGLRERAVRTREKPTPPQVETIPSGGAIV